MKIISLSNRKLSIPFKMTNVMAWTFPCFPYSYRNTAFKQSKLTFSKCYFVVINVTKGLLTECEICTVFAQRLPYRPSKDSLLCDFVFRKATLMFHTGHVIVGTSSTNIPDPLLFLFRVYMKWKLSLSYFKELLKW